MTAADLRARAARFCDSDVRTAWRAAVDTGRDEDLGMDGESVDQALEDADAPVFAALACGDVRLLLAGLDGRLVVAWDGADGPRFVDLDA